MAPFFSVIIPCRNDAVALRAALERLHGVGDLEIIVADASDTSDSGDVARAAGATVVRCDVIGRGPQLNSGAALATGRVLVFSHADTLLTPDHLQALRFAVSRDPMLLCGVYFRDFAWQYPSLAVFADLSFRWQRQFGPLYGDQTQFFLRDHFLRLGSYPDIPLMEDIVMGDRMRDAGGVRLLLPPIRTSTRRFERQGWVWTKLLNLWFLAAFRCGISPETIYRWYYGKRSNSRRCGGA